MIKMNVINISGNLARDPEVRETGTGGECLNLHVAVKRPFGHGDNGVDYFHCISFDDNDIAYARNFFKKGTCVIVSGYITFKKEEKQGKYAYSTRLNIVSMEGVARLKEKQQDEIPVSYKKGKQHNIKEAEKKLISQPVEDLDIIDCTQSGIEIPPWLS